MAKCCNYTDNTSPTLDQIKAIEVNWNKFINDFFKAIDDKYPDTDLTRIDLNEGTTLLRYPTTMIVEKHPTTTRPMYRVFDIALDPVKVVDEEVSVLRLKSHLQDIEDGLIHHNMQIHLNGQRMIVAVSTGIFSIGDVKDDPDDANKVTIEGITTLLAANKVTLRTHEGHMQYGGYKREELIISYP